MCHYFLGLSLPSPPPTLSFRVPPRTAMALLMARLGARQRLQATDVGALAGAVHVAVIAA
jgi:hypothetical protein